MPPSYERAAAGRFERIARTVRRLFDAPFAGVWLTRAGQEQGQFAAASGEPPGRGAARDRLLALEAMCRRVAAGAAPLREDAAPAFAGWPLCNADGACVGALAVAGFQPHEPTAEDEAAARDLVEWAESVLAGGALRRSLDAARDGEARLHAVIDNIADGIITLDQFGKIVSINRAAVRIFGYQPQEVLGQNVKVLMPVVYHQAHDGYLQNFRDTGRTRVIGVDREVTGRRKDGSLFSMELTVNEMWLNGERAFAGIIRDITERRENERKLRESNALLQAMMSSTSSFVYVRDLEGRFMYVNREYERLFDIAPGGAVGKTVEQVLPPALARHNRERDRALTEKDAPARLEDELTLPDPQRTFLVVRSPLFNERGEMYGTCGVGTDISERKRAEDVKNEFISTVSHELRTPLTSIRGSLGLLSGGVAGDVPERARNLLAIANNNCERLVRLINDILDIEKIESGNMRFELVPQRLLPLVEQAVAATQGYAAQYEVRVALRADAPEAYVAADADRIVQVVVNLLSNAIKFSPQGGSVEVVMQQRPGVARVAVRDRGQGVGREFRTRIFQKFAQADSSDTRQKGGTGLGLSISRAIVERHHGRIDFADPPDGGSEFYFELPLLTVAAQHAPRQGRVLVCEDDPDVARLLAMMLAQAGLSSDTAHDASQARRLLVEHAYEAMTLDLSLPREDGMSLLRWIRSQERTRTLPVVVVSARAGEGRRSLTGGAVGIVDWLSKPIDQARLVAVLQQALRGGQGETPQVLYVEDDPDLVKVIGEMLAPVARLCHAGTLAGARELLASTPFSLILLDLRLPDGHGSALLGALPPPNLATPVVVFSSDEASSATAASVHAALVKSRTSNAQLLEILHALIGHAGKGKD
ncbi:MAG TPA: PAS domain S-box protein [Noviherbaspirillum sp.]|uniref:PAS domain S-box protein n=1 Tax=Noviherbaspirillum sp. TaxID=1926288 RepID=UPI002F9282C6